MSAVRLYFDVNVLAPQQRYSISERIRRLLRLIAAKTAQEMRDQLVFLSDWT